MRMNYFIFKVLVIVMSSFVHGPYISRPSYISNSKAKIPNINSNYYRTGVNSSVKKDSRVTEK